MLIDCHCHINALAKTTREEVIASCRDRGQYLFIDSSIDMNTSLASMALSQYYDFFYTSLGLHPFSADLFSDEVIATYEGFIKENNKIIAVGEIGLDYKAQAPSQKQEEVFKSCIRLAKRANLPIIIHNRFDNPRILDILDEFYPNFERVVFHCFSYGPDMLERILKKGGYVSFSLNILRGNANILASLKSCPLQRLLLETDSPYMKINNVVSTPLDIEQVYAQAAAHKGLEAAALENQIFLNAQKVFSLPS